MNNVEAINILGKYLGQRDIDELSSKNLYEKYGIKQVDIVVLFGGSILSGGDVFAQAIKNHIAKMYMIVGGAGHTTETLKEKMREELNIDTDHLSEAQLFEKYIEIKYGFHADLLECHSTNCGNNITNLLELLESHHITFQSIILLQDSSMQRRMGATLRKYVNDKILIINYAVYQVNVVNKDRKLMFEKQVKGMWDTERYISLLMGEIPRLTDDENGYGPRGQNYLVHVDIPEIVNQAYLRLNQEYSRLIRKADHKYRK